MAKEKVLLYVIKPVMINYITCEIAEYTKYNGFYPDFIDMPEETWNDFQKLTTGDGWKTFRGIPVRKV